MCVWSSLLLMLLVVGEDEWVMVRLCLDVDL
jgi:hypothetical protein